MSMVLLAHRLTPDQLVQVRTDPDELVELLVEQDDDPDTSDRVVDLDKAWHGLHALLNGHPWDVTCPAGAAVLGGLPVGEDLGYGPARLLDAVAVAEVASALADVRDVELAARFSPARMKAWEVYPGIWDEPDVLDEYLFPSLSSLRALYAAAAAAGDAVLLVLT